MSAESASAEQPAAGTEEPQFIEVWRPGGRSDERRGPRRQPRAPRRPRGDQSAAGRNRSSSWRVRTRRPPRRRWPVTEPSEGRRGRRHGRGDRDNANRDNTNRDNRPNNRQGRPERSDRPRQDRGDRPDRGSRRPDRRPDRRDENRVYASSEKGPRERSNREADPNSPFAKLAALKAQLEANEKEKR